MITEFKEVLVNQTHHKSPKLLERNAKGTNKKQNSYTNHIMPRYIKQFSVYCHFNPNSCLCNEVILLKKNYFLI